MAYDQQSFEKLLSEAPQAPTKETVSLVGTLAKSSEPGKFVLALQDGSTITLEIAAVRGHAVLGGSVGQTIVRVDVDAGKVADPQPSPWMRAASGLAPFALATPQQAPAGTFAALQSSTFKGLTDFGTGGWLEIVSGWKDQATGTVLDSTIFGTGFTDAV